MPMGEAKGIANRPLGGQEGGRFKPVMHEAIPASFVVFRSETLPGRFGLPFMKRFEVGIRDQIAR